MREDSICEQKKITELTCCNATADGNGDIEVIFKRQINVHAYRSRF